MSLAPDPGLLHYPALIGTDRGLHARLRRVITQNNFAFTFAVEYDGRRESLKGIEQTIYAAAYEASSVVQPRVVVVGVGGGFDVLTAFRYDARQVVGIEVNAATVHILKTAYRDYFRHWVDDPRVELRHGEGRHHLAQLADEYDVLQLSGVDSYSGTPGAAHVFSESYLYTEEAWDIYLSWLSRDGIINMMRLEHKFPREMLRALVTAVGALRRAGATEPARHVIMVTSASGNFTALLVKKTPFTAAEEVRIARWDEANPLFGISAGPSRNALRENMYQRFLDLPAREQRAFVHAYPFDISPVGDDRPFFFRYSRWRHVLDPPGGLAIPVFEYTLIVLLALIAVAASGCVAGPLLLFHARGLRTPQALRYAGYFAGIGIGFMAVEMSLLQKFGLFLGHPNHALSVVLAALLAFCGLGSLFSARLVAVLGGVRHLAYAFSAVILVEHFLVLPWLPRWLVWPGPARVALVFLLVAPIGLVLGCFFPCGLERLKAVALPFAPWAWGINGIFSVLAPVLSVAFSTTSADLHPRRRPASRRAAGRLTGALRPRVAPQRPAQRPATACAR